MPPDICPPTVLQSFSYSPFLNSFEAFLIQVALSDTLLQSGNRLPELVTPKNDRMKVVIATDKNTKIRPINAFIIDLKAPCFFCASLPDPIIVIPDWIILNRKNNITTDTRIPIIKSTKPPNLNIGKY